MRHRRRGLAALAGVRLVDDDGEAAGPRCSLPISSRMNGNFCTVEMMIFLPLLDELAQVARVLGVADRRAHLRELLDRVPDLLVEDAPVGDDDDRVEDRPCRRACRPMSWCASQAMEFDLPLPAECWIR